MGIVWRRGPLWSRGFHAADTTYHKACKGAVLPFQFEDADVFLGPKEIVSLLHMERLSDIESRASVEHPGETLISLLPLVTTFPYLALGHRLFSLFSEPIEFSFKHKAVRFERGAIALVRHEHRLSVQEQTAGERIRHHEAVPARDQLSC